MSGSRKLAFEQLGARRVLSANPLGGDGVLAEDMTVQQIESAPAAEVVASVADTAAAAQGRVKAQFHWDRTGHRDENSSCWIRVSQPHAGAAIGGGVPGAAVEGDPDRPIIVGAVFNAAPAGHAGPSVNTLVAASIDAAIAEMQALQSVGADQSLTIGGARTSAVGELSSAAAPEMVIKGKKILQN